jgi:hypothetical protein
MSTVVTKNVQVGTSGTAADNFTLYQPASPDGTVRLANGNSGTTTDLVTVTSAGNVGIGTSSATRKLEVGSLGAFRMQTGSVTMDCTPTAGATDTFVWNTSANSGYIWSMAGTERARIDSSGRFLVGLTTAYSDGAIGAPVLQWVAKSGNFVGAVCSADTTSNLGAIAFKNPNGVVGQISTSGSATSYATSSDYRLKENVQPMQNALARVAALKPCTYKWKVDGSDGQGFIAHELAEVEPGCVTGEKDAVDAEGNPKYQGIDTSFLVATLTAAIQEQQVIIEQLKADVAALKAMAQSE